MSGRSSDEGTWLPATLADLDGILLVGMRRWREVTLLSVLAALVATPLVVRDLADPNVVLVGLSFVGLLVGVVVPATRLWSRRRAVAAFDAGFVLVRLRNGAFERLDTPPGSGADGRMAVRHGPGPVWMQLTTAWIPAWRGLVLVTTPEGGAVYRMPSNSYAFRVGIQAGPHVRDAAVADEWMLLRLHHVRTGDAIGAMLLERVDPVAEFGRLHSLSTPARRWLGFALPLTALVALFAAVLGVAGLLMGEPAVAVALLLLGFAPLGLNGLAIRLVRDRAIRRWLDEDVGMVREVDGLGGIHHWATAPERYSGRGLPSPVRRWFVAAGALLVLGLGLSVEAAGVRLALGNGLVLVSLVVAGVGWWRSRP